MTITGSYHRASDNAHMTYTATIHTDHRAFSAKVYDADGALAGTPLFFHADLTGNLEDHCRAWIEGCIRDRVGVR